MAVINIPFALEGHKLNIIIQHSVQGSVRESIWNSIYEASSTIENIEIKKMNNKELRDLINNRILIGNPVFHSIKDSLEFDVELKRSIYGR